MRVAKFLVKYVPMSFTIKLSMVNFYTLDMLHKAVSCCYVTAVPYHLGLVLYANFLGNVIFPSTKIKSSNFFNNHNAYGV